jgi:hypothetical protein
MPAPKLSRLDRLPKLVRTHVCAGKGLWPDNFVLTKKLNFLPGNPEPYQEIRSKSCLCYSFGAEPAQTITPPAWAIGFRTTLAARKATNERVLAKSGEAP